VSDALSVAGDRDTAMFGEMLDTSPEARRYYFDIWRS
jgi:hypothetical protein